MAPLDRCRSSARLDILESLAPQQRDTMTRFDRLFAVPACLFLFPPTFAVGAAAEPCKALFARDNLVAWCIVPFDSRQRSPEDRADLLKRLGFRRFAYDWRAEHLPTFE